MGRRNQLFPPSPADLVSIQCLLPLSFFYSSSHPSQQDLSAVPVAAAPDIPHPRSAECCHFSGTIHQKAPHLLNSPPVPPPHRSALGLAFLPLSGLGSCSALYLPGPPSPVPPLPGSTRHTSAISLRCPLQSPHPGTCPDHRHPKPGEVPLLPAPSAARPNPV